MGYDMERERGVIEQGLKGFDATRNPSMISCAWNVRHQAAESKKKKEACLDE